jgi:hypothetical protein
LPSDFSRGQKNISANLNATKIPEDIFKAFSETFFHCAFVATKNRLTNSNAVMLRHDFYLLSLENSVFCLWLTWADEGKTQF